MTFYEAALRVLEEAKKPLTHAEITTVSLSQNLLSHIGKNPELTMLSRLAAMARRPRDRRVIITAKDTFALSEWMLPEDPDAASTTGIAEPNPEESMPAYRPTERHPESRTEFVRAVGRQGDRDRKSRRDDERRRKYPPIAEVAFEQLTEGGALAPKALLERARVKEQVSEELAIEQLLHALIDDNQRRIDSGRRPQFVYLVVEGAEPQLSLDASETPGPELQQAFCALAQVPFENGRAVLKSRRPEAAPTPSVGEAATGEDAQLLATAKQAGKDARRAMARVLRKKLSELDGGTLEKSVVRMMHELSFREVKVAKRSKDGPLLTARRREGSLELRYAIRIVKGGGPVERRQVSELRRDLGHHAAHVGLIVSAGEARSDAKSEALERGAIIFLWCGEGLAERFFEAQVGVTVQTIELYELDETFFAKAQVDAEAARARRDERRGERDRAEQNGPSPSAPSGDVQAAAPSAPSPRNDEPVAVSGAVSQAPGEEGEDEEGDDEGGEGAEGGAPGGPVQLGPDGQPLGKKRRRRRRRRGRGPRPEGASGVPGAPGAEVAAAVAGEGVTAPSPSAPVIEGTLLTEAPPAVPEPAPTAPSAPEAEAPAPTPRDDGDASQ